MPAYGSASLFFIGSGFYSEGWVPALTMAGLAALAGLITYRLRRGWRERIGALHTLEKKLGEVEVQLPPD